MAKSLRSEGRARARRLAASSRGLLPAALLLAAAACVAGGIGQYVRPTTDERVEATPERLASGRYLVDGPGACGVCHTTWVNGDILGGESDGYLAGGNYLEAIGAWLQSLPPSSRRVPTRELNEGRKQLRGQ